MKSQLRALLYMTPIFGPRLVEIVPLFSKLDTDLVEEKGMITAYYLSKVTYICLAQFY